MIRNKSHLILYLLCRLLKPIKIPTSGIVGITTIIKHEHVNMLLFSLYSLYYFLRQKLPCTVIDDGTLTDDDIRRISLIFIGIHIIRAEQAKKLIIPEISAYPFCLKYRNNNSAVFNLNKKLFDANLLNNYQKIIYMDADIICLNYPKKLINWIQTDITNSLYFSHHRYPNYFFPDVSELWCVIYRIFIKHVNSKCDFYFNSGFYCLQKKYYSLPRIEKLLHYIYSVGLDQTWAPEQYIIATIITDSPNELLGDKYIHVHSPVEVQYIKKIMTYTIAHFNFRSKRYYLPTAVKLLIKTRIFSKRHYSDR
jgi:lipopolysaccharide biosynthesis glycosyltransferase